MKNSSILVMSTVVIIAGLMYYQWDQRQLQPVIKEVLPVTTSQKETLAEAEPVEKSTLQLMQERYSVLKEARRELTLTLSRLGSRLRKVEFTPEKAGEIAKLMRKASYSLKNPKLLGAFSSVDEIEYELSKVQSFQGKLQQIRQSLDKKMDSPSD